MMYTFGNETYHTTLIQLGIMFPYHDRHCDLLSLFIAAELLASMHVT